MGKRITLSRPRIESLAEESVDLAELVVPVLGAADPDDFLPDDFLPGGVSVTVDTEAVDCVVVKSVSTGTTAACAAVEEAVAVSAADWAVRAQPAANTTAETAPASDSLVIDPFPEQSEARWVCAAILSPRFPEWAKDRRHCPPHGG